MLAGEFERGFSQEKLMGICEPRVCKDEDGYYLMSLSENTKVYFEDFYTFLEKTEERAALEKKVVRLKLESTPESCTETIAYYRSKLVIIDVIQRTIRRFYPDSANLGVIMSPWCFGTVVLEKVEVYRDRMARGDVHDPNVPDYPYYVIKYLDESYTATLLEIFDFPETAFQMRWQYSELLKKYSKILSNITVSLQSVLMTIKNHRS
jgi:hypothetical protein